MRRLVLITVVASVFTVAAAPTSADWLDGPINIMRPDGTVFQIEPPSVGAWWRDYRRARCASCVGTNQEALAEAARLLYKVERALGTRTRAATRYLVLPDVLELEWPNAWVFYPSTERTPAYVVKHGGISGAAGRPLQWDVWYRATDRMEEMILDGSARSSSSEGPRGESRTNRSVDLWGWTLAAIVSLSVITLVLSPLGFVGRRWRARKRRSHVVDPSR
jgi:hypothetical protein